MTGDVLIGIGNPHRRDDAAGLHVTRRVRQTLPQRVRIHECLGEATELIGAWAGASKVVIVDAVDGGQPAGDIVRLDVSSDRMAASLKQTSTHAFGLAEAVELARTLGELPAEVVVYGVQGQDFRPGDSMSAAVSEAIDDCCQMIQAEFERTE